MVGIYHETQGTFFFLLYITLNDTYDSNFATMAFLQPNIIYFIL